MNPIYSRNNEYEVYNVYNNMDLFDLLYEIGKQGLPKWNDKYFDNDYVRLTWKTKKGDKIHIEERSGCYLSYNIVPDDFLQMIKDEC